MKTWMFAAFLLISQGALAANQVKLYVSLSPAGSFEAVSEKMKGNLVKQNGNFSADKLTVSVESFKTGIELRDEHFWKHMKSSRITMSNVKGSAGKGTGVLEINGVKKPVTMAYVEKGSDLTATFNVKPSEFKLQKAQYLGVGVNDDVKVEATYSFVTK